MTATNVSISSNLTLTFSEAVTKGSGSITISQGRTTQSISVNDVALSSDGLTATINPADFPYATTVSVEVPNTAFKDEAATRTRGLLRMPGALPRVTNPIRHPLR
jgi:hypothetical protein